MMRIIEDILGGTVTESLTDGFKATRIFIAVGVTGNKDAVQYNAIINGQIPRTGTPHPTIPKLIVDNIAATNMPNSQGQIKLTVNYTTIKFGDTSPDEEGQTSITISGTIQTVQTNKHFVKGKEKLIILEYEYPKGKSPDGIDEVKKVIPTIDKQIPLIVATLSRRETKDPAQKARDFVGKVNSRKFIGSKKGLWMCTNIGGPSSDGGATYGVTYEFMRNRGGWETDVFFTDEKTGKIPIDVEDQPKAHVEAQTQEEADFTKLNLGPFSQ